MAPRRGHPERPVPADSPARALAEYLRELRRKADVTYRQMAATVPCRHNTLSQTVDGRRTGWPPIETFIKALRAAAPPGSVPDDAEQRARELWERIPGRPTAGRRPPGGPATKPVSPAGPLTRMGPGVPVRAAPGGAPEAVRGPTPGPRTPESGPKAPESGPRAPASGAEQAPRTGERRPGEDRRSGERRPGEDRRLGERRPGEDRRPGERRPGERLADVVEPPTRAGTPDIETAESQASGAEPPVSDAEPPAGVGEFPAEGGERRADESAADEPVAFESAGARDAGARDVAVESTVVDSAGDGPERGAATTGQPHPAPESSGRLRRIIGRVFRRR